jgi:chemotaxis protein histidine kinase CheA/ActR/RegA family two-component response regulator
VPLASTELYEMFLALAPTRLAAARAALELETPADRAAELRAALLPLAVDAALLGADGVGELARAVATSGAPHDALHAALDTLENAARELGQGDESGARVDEASLRDEAQALLASPPAVPTPTPARAPAPADEDEWIPDLGEDMIAAFLDECAERLDGLAGRLLVLEQSGPEPELVGEIFRDLHTLKGSSAFAGLKKMNRVAHLAEDLMGELRDGTRSCDRALIDVLLETLDVLGAIVERARARARIDVDVSALVARLHDPSAAPAAPPGPVSVPAPSVRAALTAHAAAPAPAPAPAQATLRIDFEKVDLLLNLVGEIVLARGRLAAAAEVQSALAREIAQLRKKAGALLGNAAEGGGTRGALALASRAAPGVVLVDELQRTERVLRETFGDFDAGLSSLGLAVGQLRDNVMKLRMVPIARLFSKYQRTVRELSHKLGKEVHVELVGAETELDKVLVERLEDPLLHLVRNAVDHGVESPDARRAAGKPESGLMRLSAVHRGGQIIVTIEDDGAGMDPVRLRQKAVEKQLLDAEQAEQLSDAESFQLIFRAGFSTAEHISDVSGRGVGMDVVRDAITKLKGTIHLESRVGVGTKLELRLPLTLAITRVLAARVGGELVAIPLDRVVSAQAVGPDDLEPVADGTCLRVGDRLVPVVDLCQVLGLAADVELEEARNANVVIVEVGGEPLGLLVQQVLGRHEVVIKSLGPLLSAAPCAAGATLIGDRVLLVVDLAEVTHLAREPSKAHALPARRVRVQTRARVLVAEDSDLIRETLRRELARAGFDVTAAPDGQAALEIAAAQEPFDVVSTDVMMPRLDGYELTRALRADARYRDVPIVMVTSKDARIDTMRGYDAGANAYITKPADVNELVSVLDGLLARRRKPSGA